MAAVAGEAAVTDPVLYLVEIIHRIVTLVTFLMVCRILYVLERMNDE